MNIHTKVYCISLNLSNEKLEWGWVGLPWWHSGKKSACKYRGHRLDTCSGKISHAMEQLSPCATTTEAYTLSGLQATIMSSWATTTEPAL